MAPPLPHDSHVTDTDTPDEQVENVESSSAPALHATILCHPDSSRVGEVAWLGPWPLTSSVAISRSEPGFVAPGSINHRPLADVRLSRTPTHIVPAANGLQIVAAASGTRVVVDNTPVVETAPVPLSSVKPGVVVTLGSRIVLLIHLRRRWSARTPRHGLVGENDGILAIREAIARVASVTVPVLLLGETGTGKDLVARAIHAASPRAARPLISLNLGAIPPSLAAAELFGHTKGAFTGASEAQPGAFKEANGSTLFLDEVGEAPGELQAVLLRALESGEVRPLGGRTATPVDVRVIAATDVEVEAGVASGRLRNALIQRLAGFTIQLPPLRERRDDIGRIFFHFLRHELEEMGEAARLDQTDRPWIPAELIARAARCRWPGNVRQLRNFVRQIVITNRWRSTFELGPEVEKLLIAAGDGAGDSQSQRPPAVQSPKAVLAKDSIGRRPAELAPADIQRALADNGYEIGPTARVLGIARNTLLRLMEKSPDLMRPKDLPSIELAQGLAEHHGDVGALAATLRVSTRGLQLRLQELGLSQG